MRIKRRTKGEAALARTDQHVATTGHCNRLIHIWIVGQPAPVATPSRNECQILVDRYNSMSPEERVPSARTPTNSRKDRTA